MLEAVSVELGRKGERQTAALRSPQSDPVQADAAVQGARNVAEEAGAGLGAGGQDEPDAGDSGGAIGAAMYAYHALLGKERGFVQQHAYWGPHYHNGQVVSFLRESGIPFEEFRDEETLTERIAERLAAGKVVGFYQGRMEWGPRALGNRSILADPRKAKMKDIVNRKIKFREPFRPFAPSVLGERTEEFFDLPEASRHYPARFMLYVANVSEDKREVIPAVTHVDGTARLQVVNREHNPRYHRLIERFGEITGVPVLLNTSFNLKGEPIVNTPADAYSTFIRSEMDALVLENCLIEKQRSK